MTFSSLQKNIKSKQFSNCYLFFGSEEYFIDQLCKSIEKHGLEEEHKAFNLHLLYGHQIEVSQLVERCKQFPMGSDRQIVILKEAQKLKQIEQLESYLKSPLPSTVLVLAYKNEKLPIKTKALKALWKSLKEKGTVFESKKLYPNQVQSWIITQVKENKREISPKAAALLQEHLGENLTSLAKALEKIGLSPNLNLINEQVIEEQIGINKEYNNFELQKAIAQANRKKAFQIAQYFIGNPNKNPLILTVGILFSFFSKLLILHFNQTNDKIKGAQLLKISPFFFNDYALAKSKYDIRSILTIIRKLKEIDHKSKGLKPSTSSSNALLNELLFCIFSR